jgi:hypothetical protein
VLSLAILISSCRRYQANGFNQTVRDTWGKDSHVPYFFFVGDGALRGGPDEIQLNVPDGDLTLQTKESLAWAVRNGFSHVFRAFPDTYVDTYRLLKSNWQDHIYTGNEQYSGGYTFAHGGPGYVLGPKAIHILLDSPIEKHDLHKSEDQWVGHSLGLRGIVCHDDKRYSLSKSWAKDEADPLEDNELISAHLSNYAGKYEPQWMHATHAARHGRPFEITIPRLKGCNCDHCMAHATGKIR